MNLKKKKKKNQLYTFRQVFTKPIFLFHDVLKTNTMSNLWACCVKIKTVKGGKFG